MISWFSHPCGPKHQSVDFFCVWVKDIKVNTVNLHTLTFNKPMQFWISAKVCFVSKPFTALRPANKWKMHQS